MENKKLHEIFRVVSRFPRYISCFIAENRFILGQCAAYLQAMRKEAIINLYHAEFPGNLIRYELVTWFGWHHIRYELVTWFGWPALNLLSERPCCSRPPPQCQNQ